MSCSVMLDVHDESITFEFTIKSFEDGELTIDETFRGRKPVPLTPEAEAIFSEWWYELPLTEKRLYWKDQCNMEESYAAEAEYDRMREGEV